MTLDVLVVGGGPAGAIVATLLARAGRGVTLVERSPAYRWHAGGVFTSPAAVAALRRVGLEDSFLRSIARPIPAMRLETTRGVTLPLTYGDDGSMNSAAVGLDRAALDPHLLALAAMAGVDVRMGVTATAMSMPVRPHVPVEVALTSRNERPTRLQASMVIGADGIRSSVARVAGVARPAYLRGRVGLSFHVADLSPEVPRDARLYVFHDGYVGLAPVPRARMNVGIVLGRTWRQALARQGAERVASGIIQAVPASPDDPHGWRTAPRTDAIAGAVPIGHRVTRRQGPGWLLVGDASGFLDPFTGEGFHRAIVSAELAASTVDDIFAGRARTADTYEKAMRRQFAMKDRVSWLIQGFLSQPALFEYAARRLARRHAVRETMALVLGDLLPAWRALDPRFLIALLAP